MWLVFLLALESTRWRKASEEELLAEYQHQGTMGIIGELYTRYQGLLYGTCMKYLKDRDRAQDLVMRVVEKLTKELRKREVDNLGSWLYVLTKNECLMQLRADGRSKETAWPEKDGKFMELAEDEHPTHEAEEKEATLQSLEAGIEQLNEEQKRCVELFFLKEKSYKEIADATGYDLKKVKSYIQNGKRNLRLYLEKQHEQG